MFCPKCGNNCGDNRFCGRCGAQVQAVTVQEPQQTAWSVGMACPHCGGTKLEGKNCTFCGAQLMADMPEEYIKRSEYDTIPFGAYDGYRSFLQLDASGVLIKNAGDSERRIPYESITSILLRKERVFSHGWLSFRYSENSHWPLALRIADAVNDATTFIYVSDVDAIKMKQAYYAIKTIVEKNGGTARYIE